jgi:ATP-dependent Clp protease ATP-binding subunit ClpC
VLEEGELQDNLGHKVSFRNAVLIMTSNAGAREISRESSLGFQVQEGIMSYSEIKNSAITELKRVFRPEFLNRIDEIVVFHSLTRNEVRNILNIMIEEVTERLAEMNITLDFTRSAKEYLIDNGYDIKFGARPLRRIIQKEIEDQLAMEILKGRFKSGDTIVVSIRNGKIYFRARQKDAEKERKPEPAGVAD